MNKLLYIGLNGLAGSGKDTVAKMFKTILSKKWNSMEECKTYYFSIYTNPTQSATYPVLKEEHSSVMCIAYADQLKEICSSIFGIPLGRFYQNKANAWICINDKFQYTEIKPNEQNIITADEYYYNLSSYSNNNSNTEKYWMSLREILVYVGTYVLQISINKQIFVNIVRNKIREEQYHNPNLQYVIITDHRFLHEIEYIYENNGITVTITRDSVSQLDNIAEHDLDEEDDYDYIINNSGSYDELFETIWNIVNEEVEFKNITIDLYTRDNINNYLRLVEDNDHRLIYKLCVPYHVQKLYRSDGNITMIDPIGGPLICVGEKIEGTDVIPSLITLDDKRNEFLIWVDKFIEEQ
jgi:dephospho-CoA kinase